MTPRQIGISAGILLAVGAIGYGAGRYALPAKIVTVTKTDTKVDIQYRDRIVEKVVTGPVKTVIHTVTREVACVPGATTPVVDSTTTIDAQPVVIDRVATNDGTSKTEAKTEITKTITNEQPRLMAQGGIDLKANWSAGGSYRLLGPGWLGAEYRNDLSLKPLERITVRFAVTF